MTGKMISTESKNTFFGCLQFFLGNAGLGNAGIVRILDHARNQSSKAMIFRTCPFAGGPGYIYRKHHG